ncbi:hypothetical protein QBC37DRAFT_370642 [Rhypophila decipiens]|uniref:Uncharacterized protein n=1 Tax=Rhypophila decipiens TaxID=261697 RepID=A0AAN6YCF5_9PEZI|nr:hypothetical protein QBC37DRAFT_370642 [Rhypophila decipiens]
MPMLHLVARFREANEARAGCWRAISSGRRTLDTNHVGSRISEQQMKEISKPVKQKLSRKGTSSMADRAIQNIDSATKQAFGEAVRPLEKDEARIFDYAKKEVFILRGLLPLVSRHPVFQTRVIARIVWDAMNWTNRYKDLIHTITQRKFRRGTRYNRFLLRSDPRFTRLEALGKFLRKTRENLQLVMAATPVGMQANAKEGGYTVSLSILKAIDKEFHLAAAQDDPEAADPEAANTEDANTEADNTEPAKPKWPEHLILFTYLKSWLAVEAQAQKKWDDGGDHNLTKKEMDQYLKHVGCEPDDV